jgi:hypothetical protein
LAAEENAEIRSDEQVAGKGRGSLEGSDGLPIMSFSAEAKKNNRYLGFAEL